jgi:hypothetical protein
MKALRIPLALALALALALGLAAACTKGAPLEEEPPPAAASEGAFAPGERYRYASRASEPDATFLVLKVEEHEATGRIVHVRADGLKLKNPSDPSGYADTITHMPFADAALRSSAKARVAAGVPVPDFAAAYDNWRRAFKDDGAGVFTVPLAEAVQVMENAINP